MFLRVTAFLVLLPLSVAIFPGCNSGGAAPRGPGTIQQQRLGAALHDPYADPNLGPEVVGSRPREFQKPLAEPVRNRWLRDSWWSRTQ